MSALKRVRVVVADDHPIYREGVARGLLLSGEIEVVAEVTTGVEALDAIREHVPDVAVVDYRLPGLDGIAVLSAVVRDQIPTRVVILSANIESGIVYKAAEQGAAGYIPKEASRSEIADAVLRVARGKTAFASDLSGGLIGEIRMRADSDLVALTERERQVLVGFARGASIPQLAKELFIGASTVKTHTQRLYEKLGVSDRAAAVAEAMRRGLLE